MTSLHAETSLLEYEPASVDFSGFLIECFKGIEENGLVIHPHLFSRPTWNLCL